MKLTKLLFLFVLTFSILSCSKDDDNGSNADTDGDVLGTWIATGLDYSGRTETKLLGEKITQSFVGEAYEMTNTLTFNENPQEFVSTGSYTIELTTTVTGEPDPIVYNEEVSFLETGDWRRKGNKFYIENNGVESEAKIIELTDTTLILEMNEEQDLSQGDISIQTNFDAIMTFKRG